MEVEIPQDIDENIEKASRQLGLDKKELVRRAVLFYLHNIAEEERLKEEIEAWKRAGIEDLKNFDKQI